MVNKRKILYQRAEKRLEKGQVDKGVKMLESLIAQYPDYLPAYCSLGLAYTEQGKYDQAEKILLKAISANQKWYLPHLYLGWAYEKQQQWSQALAAYQRAVKLNPNEPQARAYLGYMYQLLDNQEAGVQELEVAYQLAPDDVLLIYNLANGLHQLGRSIEALELLDETLARFSITVQGLEGLYRLRGSVYLDLGHLKEALIDIQKAIDLNPQELQFYNDLGDIYFEMEQYEKGIKAFSQATESNFDKGNTYRRIGYTYLKLENWHEALNFFEKAKAAGETDYFGLGFAYVELGDDEKGIEYYKEEILNDGPAKTEASYYLGFAYAAIEDQDASIKAFKQFLMLSADKENDPEWEAWRLEAKRQIGEL